MRKFAVALLIAASIAGTEVGSSAAAGSGGVVFSASEEVKSSTGFYRFPVHPGDGKSVSFTLSNSSDEAKSVEVYLTDVAPAQNGGRSALDKAVAPKAAGTWAGVKGAVKTYALKAHEKKEVTFDIRVPEQLAYGQYIAVAVCREFTPAGAKGEGGETASISLNYENNTSIFVVMEYQPERAERGIEIKDMSQKILENGQYEIAVGLSNTGRILEKPKGEIQVWSADRMLYEKAFQADSIYGQTTASMAFPLLTNLEPASYKVVFSAATDHDSISKTFEFSIGKKEAKKIEQNLVASGAAEIQIQKLPQREMWSYIGLAAVVLAVANVGVLLMVKRRKKRQDSRSVQI